MKKFLFFFFKIGMLLIIIAFFLDWGYTAVFLGTNDRGKIGYIYNSKPKNYDLIILGSSRANNHFVTELFEKKGLKTYNFGMSGSPLFESELVLKTLLEKQNKIKTVIIEVDLNLKYNKIYSSNVVGFLPFIKQSHLIKEQLKGMSDFNSIYYVPFFRYLKYDTRIGIREVFMSLIHKKGNGLKNGGYIGLNSTEGNLYYDLRYESPKNNKYYNEIKQLCKVNKINLIALMTPMCENTKGMDYFDKVKLLYPEIYNYENAVEGDEYFSSCGHMNDAGARRFTAIILKDFFNK